MTATEPTAPAAPLLIEDGDGAPLPGELQRDGPVWDAVYRAMAAFDGTEVVLDECVGKIAIALAPVLAERERMVRIDERLRCAAACDRLGVPNVASLIRDSAA